MSIKQTLQQELASIEAEVDAISAAVAADTESTAINMARYARVDVRLKRVQDLMNSAVPKT